MNDQDQERGQNPDPAEARDQRVQHGSQGHQGGRDRSQSGDAARRASGQQHTVQRRSRSPHPSLHRRPQKYDDHLPHQPSLSCCDSESPVQG
jgi:hypothetical protein